MFEKKRLIKFGLPLLYAVLLFLYLFRYYGHGRIISGGEGAYFVDYITHLRNYAFSWLGIGTGIFATSLNFGYVFHLFLLQHLVADERIINFIVIYSIFYLPFFAMYLLAGELKAKPILAFMISIFYVFNPFSLVFLQGLNQWNTLAAYILPSFTYLILRFYKDNLKLFLVFGAHSFIFAFTNANPPTMILYQVALVLITIFVSLHQDREHWSPVKTMRKYLIIFSSFILFNLWWILHWFYVYKDAQVGYTTQFVLSWLRGIGRSIPVTARALNMESLLPFPANFTYDFLSGYYGLFFSHILLVTPILFITFVFFRSKKMGKDYLFLLFSLVLIIFLSKGTGGVFGRMYEYMVLYIPTFSIFKSANEKWGILFVFLVALLLTFSFKKVAKYRHKKVIYLASSLYLLYVIIPFITGNLISDYKRGPDFIGSRFFIDKREYKNVRSELNNDNRLYRVLSFSGSNNYQVALRIEGDRFYTGNDPILSNTNKPFIAPYSGSWTQRYDFLYRNISDNNYLRLLGLFNIGKIVINKDMYPWFGFAEKQSIVEIEKILDKKLLSKKGNNIDVYEIGSDFLPRFYIPSGVIHTDKKLDQVMEVLASKKINGNSRPAIFFDLQGRDVSVDKKWKTPKITFVQINPAKYKVKVEGAEGPFLLVFSESFHPGWKLYLNKKDIFSKVFSDLNIKSYFGGEISEITTSYRLIDLFFAETWNRKPILEDRHLTVNGYANSWFIAPADAGNARNYELIIEFWPQRLFYIGIFITICAFLLSLTAIFARAIWRSNQKKT